jgi:polyhydroxyalkanoate synthase
MPVTDVSLADSHDAEDAPAVAGAALDLLLTEAGLGTRARLLPGRETLRLVTRLARRPGRVLRRSSALTGELAKALAGRSELKLPRGDRRFRDPAWSASWFYSRLLQAYLAMDATVNGVIGDAELEWSDDRKLRFIAQNVVDALAPANAPLINPEVLKETIDTGGRNFVRGARLFARDIREPPRLPANVDVSKFAVGRNLGLSPGAVVLRDERFELIQYKPTTAEVRDGPILLVPPMINKFYILDLAPGRSHIEHLVGRGQQVFAVSWRNPGAEHRDWGLDAYAAAVIEAFEAVLDISGSDRAHILGYCAGGLVSAGALSHLAAVDRLEQVASLRGS